MRRILHNSFDFHTSGINLLTNLKLAVTLMII
uniref:Uncharacterized protein n=1 Tax=Rhizophora mucronata TaxID=61149 RepID=A0A2P2NUK1_RHIMU